MSNPGAIRILTVDDHPILREGIAAILSAEPYPAVKLFRDAMYASLKDKLPPDVWDYPTP